MSRSLLIEDPKKEIRRKSIANTVERKTPKPQNTLQVQECPPKICQRRRSSIRFEDTAKVSGSPTCRSRSLKSPAQNRRNNLNGSQANQDIKASTEQRNLNYSLSVPEDDSDVHRLRNFSVTSKGIINRGDSFRCKSASSSRSSSPRTPSSDDVLLQVPEQNQVFSEDVNCQSASSSPILMNPLPDLEPKPHKYNVYVVGLAGVGKSSLKLQFMTSEYILCQYDSSRDETSEKNVTIVVDGEEYELEITELPNFDEKSIAGHAMPDAFLVVFSVTNRRSYVLAKQILSRLDMMSGPKAVILVGNKTDLARLRAVSTLEGRSLAKEWSCKFIETSVAINHQVDELLVGIITQIRIRNQMHNKEAKRDSPEGSKNAASVPKKSKATGLIKRLWRKTCTPNKSCDNLHTV